MYLVYQLYLLSVYEMSCFPCIIDIYISPSVLYRIHTSTSGDTTFCNRFFPFSCTKILECRTLPILRKLRLVVRIYSSAFHRFCHLNAGHKIKIYIGLIYMYSKTWLKRTCSKTDTWLRRTESLGPGCNKLL